MTQSHLSKINWSYFVIHVVHIIKLLPIPVLNDFFPHEMLYKTAVDFNQLKVCESLCYFSTLPTNRKKKLIQGHQNVLLLVLKEEQKNVLLNIQSRELYFINIFFHIKLLIKLTVLTFFYQNSFTEDQPVLSHPTQTIFVTIATCDNVENNSNNEHESDIEVSEEICSIVTKTLMKLMKQYNQFE